MKIVFLGTPDFAVKPLLSILASKHQVVAVVTQKDKPVGRKAVITPCAVKVCAMENNILTLSYDKISKEGVEDLKNLSPDIMVTCAYGQILSQEIIDIAKYGIINIHGSLLPKYRGASPIQSSILNGEKYSGITIMQTEKGIDTGDIIAQEKLEIKEYETSLELFERLSILGAKLIVETLDNIESGNYTKTKQIEEQATYCKMIKKEDALIDFNNETDKIINLICGMNPWPVAYTYFNGKMLKIYKAEKCSLGGEISKVLESDTKNGLIIATKDSSIKVIELQLEGSKKLNYKDFVIGRKINKGDILG